MVIGRETMLATAALGVVLTWSSMGSARIASGHARTAGSAALVQLQGSCRPLRDIARDISRQAGAEVTVERSIQDWKATIAYRGALEPLLGALCANFSLVIERPEPVSEAAGAARVRYRLALTAKERVRLAKHYAEMARRERARQEQDARLLAEQILRMVAQDPSVDSGEADAQADGAGSARELAVSLGPAALRQLCMSRQHGEPPFADKAPAYSVLVSSLSSGQRQLLRDLLVGQQRQWAPAAPGAGSVAWDNYATGLTNLDSARVGFWTLNRRGMQTLHMSVHFAGQAWSPDIPIAFARSSERIATDDEAAQGEDEEELPGPTARAREEDALVTLALNDADYARAVLALSAATGRNIVADAFTLNERVAGTWDGVPLRDVLGRYARKLHVTRKWADGVLLFRLRRWEDRLAEEPPAALLDALTDRLNRNRPPSLEDLLYVATRLTREQVSGLARWRDGAVEFGVGPALSLRSHLRLFAWLGSLSDAERRSLFGAGIRASALGSAQSRALASLAADAGLTALPRDATLRVLQGMSGGYPPELTVVAQRPDGTFLGDLR